MTPLEACACGDSGAPYDRPHLEATHLGRTLGRDQYAWTELADLMASATSWKEGEIANAIHDQVSPGKYSDLDCGDWKGVLGDRAVDAIHDLGEKAGLEALAVETFKRPKWVGKNGEDMASAILDELAEALGEGTGAMMEWDEILHVVRRSVAARRCLSDIFEDDMGIQYDEDDMEKNREEHRAALAARTCDATPPAGWGPLVQVDGESFHEYVAEHVAMAKVLRALLAQDEAAAALVSDEDVTLAKRGAARGQG